MSQSLDKLRAHRASLAHLTVEESIQVEGQMRYEHGLKKYGITLDRDDLTLLEWLQHHKEELYDAIRYDECIMRKIEGKSWNENFPVLRTVHHEGCDKASFIFKCGCTIFSVAVLMVIIALVTLAFIATIGMMSNIDGLNPLMKNLYGALMHP